MSHTFSAVPSANIRRSQFNRSHGYKSTIDTDYLYPIYVDEALPGDTFKCKMNAFARLATPIVPIMDNLMMDTFFFAVPYRLVWDNWERFNGAQDNPNDSTDYLIPQLASDSSSGFTTGSIFDYMGLPVGVPDLEVNSLHMRAYNLIYNEWFRDINLIDSVSVPKGDGPDAATNFTLLKRGKRHDYFTSCLPWPQKGEDVLLPLGQQAPLKTDLTSAVSNNPGIYDATDNPRVLENYTNNNKLYLGTDAPDALIYADLTAATAATVNQLREAFAIQRLYERDARGGTRYIELVRSHFNVISPDMRQQRPEYLGGGSSRINIHPIAQTSGNIVDIGETPQGNLAAIGTASIHGHGFSKSFTEHNLIIGLINIRADLTYSQGLDRMWTRQKRFDFYWPSLSNLGEQPVLAKEIYCDGSAADETVFGYQERFAEYRYANSKITGLMRSNPTSGDSVDIWHLSQNFANHPTLSQDFIEESVPLDRVVATPDEPKFYFDSYFSINCIRPMPTYAIPGLSTNM